MVVTLFVYCQSFSATHKFLEGRVFVPFIVMFLYLEQFCTKIGHNKDLLNEWTLFLQVWLHGAVSLYLPLTYNTKHWSIVLECKSILSALDCLLWLCMVLPISEQLEPSARNTPSHTTLHLLVGCDLVTFSARLDLLVVLHPSLWFSIMVMITFQAAPHWLINKG